MKAYNEAVNAYQKSLEIQPDNGTGWFYLGMAHFELHQYKEAIACYQKSLEFNPQDAKLWNYQAMSHIQLQEFEEAILCYKKSLEMTPDSLDLYASLGFCYMQLKVYKEAIAWLQKCLKIQTKSYEAWIHLNTCYLALDRPDEALFAACRAYDLNENHPPAFYALLKSLVAMKYRHAAFFLIKRKFPETTPVKNNKNIPGPKKQDHLVIYGKELADAWTKLLTEKEQPATEQEKRFTLLFQHKKVLQEIGEYYWVKQKKHLACCYFQYLFEIAPEKNIMISEKSKTIMDASIGLTYFEDADYEQAFPYIEKAAKKKNTIALHILGLYYQHGYPPVEKNRQLALATFKQAGKAGCSDSLFEIAFDHASKEPPEPVKAFKYYKAAAQNDKNNVRAQFETALFYIEGIVIPQDFTKADFYLKRAATDYRACFMLGLLYGFGIQDVIQANSTIALLYLKKAKSLGCKNADRLIDLIGNPENQFVLKIFSSIISLVKRKYIDIPPPNPIIEKKPEPKKRNQKNKNRNPGKPVVRPQKTSATQEIFDKEKNTVGLEENPLNVCIVEMQPTILESMKKKNAEILQHALNLIFDQASDLAFSLHMPVVVFHCYDFALQICTQIMKAEIQHLGITITKRLASDRPKPKLQLSIKESIGYLNEIFDTYERYRVVYELFLFSLRDIMLCPVKRAEVLTSYEFIADLYKKFLLEYSQCMEKYDKMLESIEQEKIAYKLQKQAIQPPKPVKQQQQKAPSPYKCEQNTLKETETMIGKTHEKINTLFRLLFSKNETKTSILEVNIAPYQKEFDLVRDCTDTFVLTGSTALELIREALFHKGALCSNKKYFSSTEQDRDFCGVYVDAERTSTAGFSPSLRNSKLFSYTGGHLTAGHVELYFLFGEQKASFNELIIKFQTNAVTTMDAFIIDKTGLVYGKLEWLRDIIENQVRLVNDSWKQFNQDSVRIFYVVKKILRGGIPDMVCKEAIETWVKKGTISDVDHFKNHIKRQINKKELTWVTAFFKVLYEYEILNKVFGTHVKNIQQLQLLLSPVEGTTLVSQNPALEQNAHEPGATVSNLGIFADSNQQNAAQSDKTAVIEQPALPNPPETGQDPEYGW